MGALGLSFVAPREVEWVEVDLPKLTGDQVLIRTLFSGISPGSELLAYRGLIDPTLPLDETLGALGGTFTYPFRYGYSCVGVVEDGDGLGRGDLVFAFSPHQTAFVAPPEDLVVLESVPARHATMFPLVETGLQIALEAGAAGGSPVVVIGLGPVGILTGALLLHSGVRVLGSDPLGARRDVGTAFGIECFDPRDLPGALNEETQGGGVPLVVESSGNPAGLRDGLELLAHEGTALVASWYGTKAVELPLGGRFHRRRLTIRSTQVSTIPANLAGEWTVARRRSQTVALMQELPLDLLATHTWPHTSAADAFAALDSGQDGLIHAALSYE